jgi:Ca2+-transporting ATPase
MLPGLNLSEVKFQLNKFGYNELPITAHKNIFKIASEVIKEPMFVLLLCCGFIYMLLGDYKEGMVLVAATVLIIFITFYQYQKTERALEALKNLSSPRALVYRLGIPTRIPGREVVPDDILILNEGDRVAADAIIINANNLYIDESLLTGESAAVKKNENIDPKNIEGIVYSGTLVIKGTGIAKVFATGVNTNFGKIGSSLQEITPPDTPLQSEMKLLIKNLFLIGVIISVCVVIAFYFSRGNIIKAILNGLSTSMAILPEEFPVVLTVFLAIGAWRLSKKNVLTRTPSAIETLGATTTLCVDKTGTITQNKMEIAMVYNGTDTIDYLNFNTNTFSITPLLNAAFLASHANSVDPMEKAIHEAGITFGLLSTNQYNVVKEYPISHDIKAMTHVLDKPNSDHYFVFTKGAPETVFDLCKLNKADREKYSSILNMMAAGALRVIAVAEASIVKNGLPIVQSGFDFQFKGLIAFADPIRPEVPAAIKECLAAGIKVIIITGDFPITAMAVAKKIGLESNAGLITGDELDKLSDTDLAKHIEQVSIFARVVPSQKLRIVQALKAKNEIVAMTGDGVNDAPALKAAHIGISMGNRGTDVAREASSLVLLDDNFASIVAAIRLGRKIFDNLQKAMSYILAIHIPIIGLTLLPALFSNVPLLLMPLHIVFLELIIDPVCSIAFESEADEKGIMSRPPRDPTKKFFGKNKLLISLMKGMLLLTMILVVYGYTLYESHNEQETRAIIFTSLIIGNVFLILSSLSSTKSFIAVILEKNYMALLLLIIPLIALFFILTFPSAQLAFGFTNPGLGHFTIVLIASFILLFLLELFKYFSNKHGSKNFILSTLDKHQ